MAGIAAERCCREDASNNLTIVIIEIQKATLPVGVQSGENHYAGTTGKGGDTGKSPCRAPWVRQQNGRQLEHH